MKLSCIPICLFDKILRTKELSVEGWVESAAGLGLDGIEMYEPYLESWERDYIEGLSEVIRDTGLEVSMFTSYSHNFSHPDPNERAEEIEHVKRAIDVADVFGAKIVRLTAGVWHPGVGREETLRNVASCFEGLLDYAEAKGIVLALEDHPQIGTKIEDFMRILELVDDERLKVNLDTSNPLTVGDDPAKLAELVKDKVVHVHASDRDASLEHVVLGEGIVNFGRIFGILKEAGFDGWISLEAGGPPSFESVLRGIENLRREWAGG